ncbi:MAG: hypothetical protein JWN95_850 [Frankiales bacterium]|nr:hypothetical protein [Frankiales bacterium]
MPSQSALQRVPARERRRLALMLLPMALALLALGLVSTVVSGPLGWKVVGGVVLIIACALLGIVLGLQRSAAITDRQQAEQQLDATLMGAVGACGSSCGSGADACDADCAIRTLPRN